MKKIAPILAPLLLPISNIIALDLSLPFPDGAQTSAESLIAPLLSKIHFRRCDKSVHLGHCVVETCSVILNRFRTTQCQKHMIVVLKAYWPSFMDTQNDQLVVPGAIARIQKTAQAGMYIQIPAKLFFAVFVL